MLAVVFVSHAGLGPANLALVIVGLSAMAAASMACAACAWARVLFREAGVEYLEFLDAASLVLVLLAQFRSLSVLPGETIFEGHHFVLHRAQSVGAFRLVFQDVLEVPGGNLSRRLDVGRQHIIFGRGGTVASGGTVPDAAAIAAGGVFQVAGV